ncbi:MAG: hypothetical protein KDC71_23955, partial [Acidobacteria bacterium]|nr:hypothetical protein [Acidobacteriota bacterium]
MKRIRDIVEVERQPTVIRLDHLLADDAAWLSDQYYLSKGISAHLQLLKRLFQKETGSGIFLIGHFGSGKSHF